MANNKDIYAIMLYGEICSEHNHLLVYTNVKQVLAKLADLENTELTYKLIALEDLWTHELSKGGDKL